jgi:hypothetical protein
MKVLFKSKSFKEARKFYNEQLEIKKRALGSFCEETPSEYLESDEYYKEYAGFNADYGYEHDSFLLCSWAY